MSSSVGMIIPNIWGKKNPNHQPGPYRLIDWLEGMASEHITTWAVETKSLSHSIKFSLVECGIPLLDYGKIPNIWRVVKNPRQSSTDRALWQPLLTSCQRLATMNCGSLGKLWLQGSPKWLWCDTGSSKLWSIPLQRPHAFLVMNLVGEWGNGESRPCLVIIVILIIVILVS